MSLPLSGILVVSIEQAVAAPMCSCRLADAGARVIKIERPDGDFARRYDALVHGESAYFVWLNRGKESCVLDLAQAADKALLEAMLARADVFIQNLKPGAVAKLGFPISRLRQRYPRLVCCSISGYGESGPYAQRNAYEAILEVLPARERSGQGAEISVSMFDAMADWMTVPLLQHEGGQTPARGGLNHPTISPYGVFKTRDGADVLISIQNDREWVILARDVMGDAALARDPDFATNVERVKRRADTDGRVAAAFGSMDIEELTQRLMRFDIAFGRVNDPESLRHHPHLRRIEIGSPTGAISHPSPAALHAGAPRR